MITPLEIENKEFSKQIRGYNADEVDEFLDLIIEDIEIMQQIGRASCRERVLCSV